MDDLYEHSEATDGGSTIELTPHRRAETPVNPLLYGKFAEHLAWNVSHGMTAQLLYNPTFERWWFRSANATSDGGFAESTDPERRDAMVEEHASQRDYPGADGLKTAVTDGLSFWWQRRGPRRAVTVSPDTGQGGGRAQRVEVETVSADRPRGIKQWVYLPLQRTKTYEYTVTLRTRAGTDGELRLALYTIDDTGGLDERLVGTRFGISDEWSTVEGTFAVPEDGGPADDELVALSLTTDQECHFVVDRLLLYPDDHVEGADPDVVEFLRDANLPLLRWPGGNFASDYDWRDGVGPKMQRPTNPNPAWGGVEPNRFGTDEFLQLCETVGCEPLICVNAGSGTPELAAKWVEYCNGDPEETDMGRLRADNGHPAPYGVQYWEVGNELYGRWQPNWTTPDGNVDRYRRFRDAIRSVDSEVKLLATGRRGEWNDRLVSETAPELRTVTDHALVGPAVDPDVDHDTLYHALMGYVDELDRQYSDLVARMGDAGVPEPRIAITELQLTVSRTDGNDHALSPPWRGSRHHDPAVGLPGKKSIAEAVWDATIIHNAIRSGDAVELVAHTGTVNHGGGLQKRKERVWADPCHYGHVIGSVLSGKTPVGVDVACDTVSTDGSVAGFGPVAELPVLDAVAAVAEDELAVVVVHRGSGVGDVRVRLGLGGLSDDGDATVTTLSGDSMASENTIENPENVSPHRDVVPVEGGSVRVTVPEYSLVQIVASRPG